MRTTFRPLLLALALACVAPPASAEQCTPPNGLSPCVDADNLWLAPEGGRFVSIPNARTLGSGRSTFAVGVSYLSHPIVLDAPSPDPYGREILVVDDALDATLLWAYGVTRHLELGAALPMVLRQTGAGIGGLTSQSAPPLARSAVRDPRIGAGYSLVHRRLGRSTYIATKARLDLDLPFGDPQFFAGERSFVAAPGVVSSLRLGHFYAAGSLGLRLRRSVELAGARVGSQLASALGVGADILPRGLLSFGAETWLLPALVSQDRTLRDGTRIDNAVLVPAEWLASLRSSPLPSGELTLQLGGGTAIPLSSLQRVAPDGTRNSEHFAGITTPRFRFVLIVRYVPREDTPR